MVCPTGLPTRASEETSEEAAGRTGKIIPKEKPSANVPSQSRIQGSISHRPVSNEQRDQAMMVQHKLQATTQHNTENHRGYRIYAISRRKPGHWKAKWMKGNRKPLGWPPATRLLRTFVSSTIIVIVSSGCDKRTGHDGTCDVLPVWLGAEWTTLQRRLTSDTRLPESAVLCLAVAVKATCLPNPSIYHLQPQLQLQPTQWQ